MTTLVFRKFDGEVPRLAAWELPDTAAQVSNLVDHTKGILSPIKTGSLVASLTGTTGTVRGVYTEGGALWYSWDAEVFAFKSPVIGDTYSRMYYLLPGEGLFRVAPIPSSPTGGAPTLAKRVGVPAPTVAPVLTLVDRTQLPDYPTAAFTFKGRWEFNNTITDAQTLSATEVTWMKKYTVSPPVNTGDPNAVFVVEALLAQGTTRLFSLNTSVGTAITASTTALPGGVEMTLEKVNDTTYNVIFAWGIAETRAYTYTMYNSYNEESVAAPAKLISPTYLQDVVVKTTNPIYTGYVDLVGPNIYRTFGSGNTYIRCTIAYISPADTYLDTTSTTGQLGPTLVSALFAEPPIGLAGIEYVANGWFAAFKGNTLYMSEPYRPHAWPYNMAFGTNIRGIKAGAQGLVVTTADACYTVTGNHPGSANQLKLPVAQSGVSHRTMAVVDGVVVFASPDGLVAVEGSQASLKPSHQYFNRSDWQRIYANGIGHSDPTWRFASYDGRLIAVNSSGTLGFVIGLDEGLDGSTLTNNTLATGMLTYVPELDWLVYSVGNNIYKYAGGTSNNTYNWLSKEYQLPSPTAFGAVKLRAVSGGLIGMAIRANGVVVFVDDVGPRVTNTLEPAYFRLPAFRPSDRWDLSITSNVDVYEVCLASSFGELKSV
jgi:hypothetical protein